MKVSGIALNVRHSTSQVSEGSGNEARIKTIHSALFEINRQLLIHKQERDPIPISEGDEIVCAFGNGRPARVLAYRNLSNGAVYMPSLVIPCFVTLIGGAMLTFTFLQPQFFFPDVRIPNTEIALIWVPRGFSLLLALTSGFAAKQSLGARSSIE